MPGRYLTQYEMLQLVTEAAQPAIQKYGIKNTEDFIWALMAVSFAECGSTTEQGPVWDSQSVHDNGQGFSLFALHNRGYAGYLTPEERQDPATNAGAAALKLGQVWSDGATFDANVEAMTGPQGQNPADPQALYRNAMALHTEQERVSGRPGGFGMAGQVGQGAGGGIAAEEVIAWMVPGFKDAPGYSAREQAEYEFYDDPMKWTNFYRQETEQQTGLTPLERGAKEAQTALDWANVESIIAWDEGKTYEQGRQRILDKIDQEHWTAEQAISEFNAWMAATTEAGRRAETAYGEEKERAVWTRPTPTYERPAHRQVMESYGLEYTPEQGIPVSQMPNLEQMYSQWNQNLGIQQQAPPTAGGWQTGQGMGQGTDRARAFLRGMNLPSAAGM